MKFRLDYVALPVFFITLGYNCWHWGSTAQLADVGPVIADRAAREAPLVQTYLYLGRQAIDLGGWQESAAASAEATFGPARERLLAAPTLAIDYLFKERVSSSQSRLRTTHWLCPLSLVLFIIGWIRRPKKIQTIRTGQRR